jgi:hypothetical protein
MSSKFYCATPPGNGLRQRLLRFRCCYRQQTYVQSWACEIIGKAGYKTESARMAASEVNMCGYERCL